MLVLLLVLGVGSGALALASAGRFSLDAAVAKLPAAPGWLKRRPTIARQTGHQRPLTR